MPLFDQSLLVLVLSAALGCGLISGVFFAFSAFVMKALFRLPASDGIAAMQSINVAVLNLWFLGAFFGTAVVCLCALVLTLVFWPEPVAGYLLAGSLLYLVGTVLVTIVFNVPRNESLAVIAPGDAAGESQWTDYVTSWTAWNHVRTAAALAASAMFGCALVQGYFE